MAKAHTIKLRDKAVLVDEHGREVGEIQSLRVRWYDEPEPVPAPPDKLMEVAETVADVWNEYVRLLKPRNKALGPEERRLILAALKVATADELKRAVLGCTKSEWHMNTHPETRGKNYHRLSNIIKGKKNGKTTREQIDFFLDIADKQPGGSRVTSAERARIDRAKRDVLDMLEFPNDEHVVRRGEEAKAWLQERNWTVEIEGGSVSFRPPTS